MESVDELASEMSTLTSDEFARSIAYRRGAFSISQIDDGVRRLASAFAVGAHVHVLDTSGGDTAARWLRLPLESDATSSKEWECVLDLRDLQNNNSWMLSEFGNWENPVPLELDNDRYLIGFSPGGGDAVEVREYDAKRRAVVSDGFRAPLGRAYFSWIDADTVLIATTARGFSATRSGYPREVRIWKRGSPLSDSKVVFRGHPEDRMVVPRTVRDGSTRRLFVIRHLADGRCRISELRDGELVSYPDLPSEVGRLGVEGVVAGKLILRLQADWRHGSEVYRDGSLVAFDVDFAGHIREVACIFEPAENESIPLSGGLGVGDGFVLFVVLRDVRPRLCRARLVSNELRLETIPIGDDLVYPYVVSADAGNDILVVRVEGITHPPRLLSVNATNTVELLAAECAFPPDLLQVTQRFAASRDGVKIPYLIAAPHDAAYDGSTPTLMTGYGGFGSSVLPHYLTGFYCGPYLKPWFEGGGAFVIANVRGGGEYGARWHNAGSKSGRLKTFDDFEAVSEDLVRIGLTNPHKLGAFGGSNGSLLVTCTAMRRPDLFAAIEISVPIADIVGFLKTQGVSQTSEFGDPNDPIDRATLEAYSPLQNLSADKNYPEFLILTSTTDDRVDPSHARNLAVRLRDLGQSVRFIELSQGGHLIFQYGNDSHINALRFAFFHEAIMTCRN